MRSDEKRRRLNRKTTVESLEERRVMSADPLGGLLGNSVSQSLANEKFDDPTAIPALELHASTGLSEQAPDFWLDTTHGSFEDQLYEIEQTLASAHGVTGLTQVRESYGFLGSGQTVAVIDSGIAWDHYALGGGLGANYRVVGGWDFTENDADPYDDGPRGSHGTHVSGIIGADTGSNAGDTGVAPGVDLVGLRVFNDSGAGYFSWVEDALEWVHLNRNSFENPITTVNLSLGTNWNADTVPSWAMLEDEFAQLEADGIFIAVSAGNSFATYNTPGLSYPAASSHVVPVMSVDDSGLLSYFSHRSDRSIAAPGRYIRSTMPDYGGNHNGRTDDWASMSGTSMASPYVAGASAIIREAMEFVGHSGITQQTIYDHMIATADRFFDAATNAYYNRLNLASAIDALIPDDDFGSSVIDAYNMGSLGSSMEIAGLIGTLDDADYFTFTASASGTVSLSVTGTHGMEPTVNLVGAEVTLVEGMWTFDVVAGGTYALALQIGGEDHIGYYEANMALEATTNLVKEIFTEGGSSYALDSDGWLSINGTRTWANTQDFAIGADGTLYLLGTDGQLRRQLADQSWQDIRSDATKFAVSANGVVYSLGTTNRLSIDGREVWANTRDFSLEQDGTLYWLGTTGRLQRLQGRTWQDVDFQVTKFDVSGDGSAFSLNSQGWLSVEGRKVWSGTSDFSLSANGALSYVQQGVEHTAAKILVSKGVVYSLDREGWLSINGVRKWSTTNDFAVGGDGTLYWLGTSGLLQMRLPGGSWKDIARDVVKFEVSGNGAVYSLDTESWLSVNGRHVWGTTSDFAFARDGTLFWQSTSGLLQKRVPGGSWQDIDRNSTRYAIGNNGMVYSLSSTGQVKADDTAKWSNIQCMGLTDAGYLEFKCADGGTYWCAGRFEIGREMGGSANTFAGHFLPVGVSQSGGEPTSYSIQEFYSSAALESMEPSFVYDVGRTSAAAIGPPTTGTPVARFQQVVDVLHAREDAISGDSASWQAVSESSTLYDWQDYEVEEQETLGEELEKVASQIVGNDNPSADAETVDRLFERIGTRE